MTTNWDGYEFCNLVLADPQNLPRAEARQVFNECMETKGARIDILGRLLSANGVKLGKDDAAIQALNDWFLASVEADPEHPGLLRTEWYSVVHDVALFLGDVVIERNPNLDWKFFTWGKTDDAFQRHVIMGFSTEDPKFHTNMDIHGMVSGYAHAIIESRGSIPVYGKMKVRGVEIDVDVSASRQRSPVAGTCRRARLTRTPSGYPVVDAGSGT